MLLSFLKSDFLHNISPYESLTKVFAERKCCVFSITRINYAAEIIGVLYDFLHPWKSHNIHDFPRPFPCPSGVPCCENTHSGQFFTTKPATHGITNGQAVGFTYYKAKKRTAASITETRCPLFFFYLIPILRGLKLLSKKTSTRSLRPEWRRR